MIRVDLQDRNIFDASMFRLGPMALSADSGTERRRIRYEIENERRHAGSIMWRNSVLGVEVLMTRGKHD